MSDAPGGVDSRPYLEPHVVGRDGRVDLREFEQRAENLTVDYPVIVENYRAEHAIAMRQSAGQASTEDLRQAMVYYRTLFQELLEERQPQRKGA